MRSSEKNTASRQTPTSRLGIYAKTEAASPDTLQNQRSSGPENQLSAHHLAEPSAKATAFDFPTTDGHASSDGVGSRLLWVVDQETGETVPFERVDRPGFHHREFVSPQVARAKRYALKAVVNQIMPGSRTAKCSRWRAPKQSVQVLRSREHSKAHYSGLQRCASVWHCPVCAAKISERRRVELQSAVAVSKAMGWRVYLLTLTVPHGLGDDIHSMLDSMLSAWRKTNQHRAGRAVFSAAGVKGTVRALEVTDGPNGFHPHFHALIFLDSSTTPSQFQAAFLPVWQKACVASGLPCPSEAHGVRVDDGSYAAAYASKWGIESELTKGHSKHGRASSMTPWDLLRDFLDNKSDRSRSRFLIYADAFKGRRQLYWSNGLKSLLSVVDLTDDELIAQDDERSSIIAELTADEWRAVLSTRSEAALLDVAENHPGSFSLVLQTIVAMVFPP